MLQIFTKDSIILYQIENAKTNNNIVGYHLVKDLHITSKISCFSFTYVIMKTTLLLECYLKNYASWMFHKKRELT